MKFKIAEDQNKELWFNDVFIYQNYSDVSSRKECSVNNGIIKDVTLPIFAANMNAVSWKRMCETLSRYWGLWILPQDMNFETKIRIVKHVMQNASVEYDTPLRVSLKDNVWIALDIINKKNNWCVVLVDDDGNAIWYYTESDLWKHDRFVQFEHIKARSAVKASFYFECWEDWIVFKQLNWENELKWFKELYEYLLTEWEDNAFIYEAWKFQWIIYKKDIIRRTFFNDKSSFWFSHDLDKESTLLKRDLNVWIAIWINQVFDEKEFGHIQDYFDAWARIFVIDTAHGYQEKMIQAVKKVRNLPFWKDLTIIAGNVCTEEGTKALIEAWANWVKVWIGPGAMCTTRMMTAVGRPQFSAVVACSKVANDMWWFVVADWGIKYTRDFCLALAAWAKFVMIWTLLSWTKESVWEVKYDEKGLMYKVNYWMASSKAVLWRNQNQSLFDISLKNTFNEWISTSRIYLREGLSTTWEVCEKLISWLKSSMTYVGARNLEEYQDKAVIWVQTQSWYNEWTPHWNLIK